jgi:hypothetical protein
MRWCLRIIEEETKTLLLFETFINIPKANSAIGNKKLELKSDKQQTNLLSFKVKPSRIIHVDSM